MKPLTPEWVEKAEGDLATAQREVRARKCPNYDSACFHAQPCVEKYLKARLQEASIPFTKTHDLAHLLDMFLGEEPLWTVYHADLDKLTEYAVRYRYPGESADRDEAKAALTICREIRTKVRTSLGLHD
jgi:HEPN domain-containing protein